MPGGPQVCHMHVQTDNLAPVHSLRRVTVLAPRQMSYAKHVRSVKTVYAHHRSGRRDNDELLQQTSAHAHCSCILCPPLQLLL